jgi:hypothetical protein
VAEENLGHRDEQVEEKTSDEDGSNVAVAGDGRHEVRSTRTGELVDLLMWKII